MPRADYVYNYQYEPLANHMNSYLIVKIIGENPNDDSLRFRYYLSFAKSRLSRFEFVSDKPIHLSVIPYESITNSKYDENESYIKDQAVISEFCNNYFPIPTGYHIFDFGLVDVRNSLSYSYYPYFGFYRYFHVEKNQSVYIEVYIKSDSYFQKIIDTPKNIFLDMCK